MREKQIKFSRIGLSEPKFSPTGIAICDQEFLTARSPSRQEFFRNAPKDRCGDTCRAEYNADMPKGDLEIKHAPLDP